MKSLTDRASAQAAGRRGVVPRLGLALLAGALTGAAVAAFSPGAFGSGWLAAALLASASLALLAAAWQWAGGGRRLAWMVALAFFLRLFMGIGLSQTLPSWGYTEPEQQAGYLFKDAYHRDTQAWDLARSDRPLWASFRDEFATDQYGGLLAVSALVYRYLSPDAHRPYLILILGAFFAALGVPFLIAAARARFSERIAALAAWIYVLYPDAIFFASAQMREPFLVGLLCVAFWALLRWDWKKKSAWLALIGSLLGMALISSRVAAAAAGFLGLLFLLENVVSLPDRRWKTLGWLALGLGLLAVLAFSWEWFRSSSGWDALVTWRNSGVIAERIKEIGEQWVLPFVIVYGVAQPVLPAAIADTSIPFWHTIAIFRAAGWYALIPFLLYGFFTFWREQDGRRRRLVFWLAAVVFLWLLIAAARGGGDVTDNPRYRSLFIPWLALLAAWSVDWALAHRDAWLWRWVAVEAIFLSFFTHWYLSRYFHLWVKMPFWVMVVSILVLAGGVLVGGWAWDRFRRQPARQP